ncbi:MAG: BamA/TamA family outer membrane protein [Bdellovibrionales bacterium]|jgi:translocation and assembly module TamA|nr:BamA/TamA family outer membrane protein [Bdellovibrionales bacterium]
MKYAVLKAKYLNAARRHVAAAVMVAAVMLTAVATVHAEVDYKPVIAGDLKKGIADELRRNSYLFQFLKNKPLSVEGLERRAADDVLRLRDTMIGHAYYGADIKYKLEGDAAPYTVTLDVQTGPKFTIGSYDIEWRDKAGRKITAPAGIDAKRVLRKVVGQDATPEEILERERQLLDVLKQNGYPMPEVFERKAVIDHATQKAAVTLAVGSGTRADFGAIGVSGHEAVQEDFIRRRIGWQQGDTFNIDKVVNTRRKMLNTGLFSTVDITLDAKPGARTVPAEIKLVERKARTIGAGLSYSTSRSIEGKIFWEHRNLAGGGEKLRVEADAGLDRYGLGAALTKPDFGGTIKRSLQFKTGFRQEFLDAYDKTSYSAAAGLSHDFNGKLSATLGGGLEFSQVKEKNKPERDFLLLSLPMGLKYDTTTDALDPTKGMRAAANVTPYMAINQSQETFTTADVSFSHYWPINEEKIVFANRVKIGAIFGENAAAIPADKRLYSGGGGSVRGYGYQLISPLDANDDPTGGRFQVEVGSEVRFRVTDNIGIVPFVEGGRVTEDIGGSDEKFLWAAGIGVRYYTAVGPVRADIAVPINGRDKDDTFQLYFSLGQAF